MVPRILLHLMVPVIFLTLNIPNVHAQKKFQHERLITIWETRKYLKTTESVLYDPEHDQIYVSNINQHAGESGQNGYISILNLKGDILQAQWIKNLNAPKGMGIYRDKLYVADQDALVEIDIKKGEIIQRYPVANAHLNDLTVDATGTVFISDPDGSAIYTFRKGKIDFFMQSADLQGINGLCIQGNLLYAGLSNSVISIDKTNHGIRIFNDHTGPVDGLVASGKGSFFISDWKGHIYEIREGQQPVLMLDTTPLQINAADIEFIRDKNILLVPTFLKDNVVAYQVKTGK